MSDGLNALKIYEALKKYSSLQKPMAATDVHDKIQNISISTINSTLDLLYYSNEYDVARLEQDEDNEGYIPYRERSEISWNNRKKFYAYQSEWEESEIKLLTYAISAHQYIGKRQTRNIIDKVNRLLPKCGVSQQFYSNQSSKVENSNILFLNLNIIEEAIAEKCCISFRYGSYDYTKKLSQGKLRKAEPYKILFSNGYYYLIARYSGVENILNLRIDRICGAVSKLDERIDLQKCKDFVKNYSDLRYHNQTPYMFSGIPERIEFLCEERMVNKIIDTFGFDATMKKQGQNHVRLWATVTPEGAMQFALQHCQYVEIIAPKTLRLQLKNSLSGALNKYK